MAESATKPADAGSLAPTQGKVQEMDITHQKNAVGYREYLEAMGLEASDRELRKLRWKIDAVILPMFLITQALQFMDKTSLNYANILGYQAALGLKGQEFNYLSAMGVRFLMGLFEAAVTPPLDYCNSGQPPVHCVGSVHGIPPRVKYMGPARVILAG
ncbi:hypothetical protein SLS64_012855 [Diaporthe eres]